MRWISTDAAHHGHAAPVGNPTTGNNAAATTAAPIEITTVIANGSSPPLMVSFHPAWQAAAISTTEKTKGSIAGNSGRLAALLAADHGRLRFTSRGLNPGTPLLPTPWARRAGTGWGGPPPRRAHARRANPNGDRPAWRVRARPCRPDRKSTRLNS